MNLQTYIKDIRKDGERCFTIEDVVERFQVPHSHARVALHRLLKTGDLISPARGLYVIVPPEDQPHGSIPAEELIPLMMRYLNVNYYVALLTAGLFHGATHQKPAKFQIISDKRIKRPLIFGDVEIDFIYKKSLSGLPTQDFVVSTGYLKLSTPELVALDLLHYPNHAGGLNHMATVLSELVEKLDAIKLIELAKNIKVEYQLQRIGYILDNIEVMDDNHAQKIINLLASQVSTKHKYLPLAPDISKVGYSRCKKWRIIENAKLDSDL
jgi:predicted transcriptional regulator of viral defense system